jgi:hypothetical protein
MTAPESEEQIVGITREGLASHVVSVIGCFSQLAEGG